MHNKINKLPNGIITLTDQLPRVNSVALRFLVKFGSRYEQQNFGIAHFIEHMMFKGTEKRNYQQLAIEMEQIGADFNAFTSKEYTIYTITVLKDYLEKAIEILSDIMLNSTFSEIEVNKERKVILQEIAQCIDDPEEYLFDQFGDNCYQNQPMGHNILGTIESVEAITRKELLAAKHQYYCAENIIIAVCGNIDHQEITQVFEKYFSSIHTNEASVMPSAHFTTGLCLLDRELEQSHIVIGYEGLELNHPDYYAQQLFSMILGGGMSSRLFQEVRENQALAYYISSFTSAYPDTGIFGISGATTNEQITDLFKAIIEVIRSMQKIEEVELERVKQQFKASSLMAQDSIGFRADYMLNSYIKYGKIRDISQLVQEVLSLDTRRVANIYNKLAEKPPVLGIIGNNNHSHYYEMVKL